MNRVSRLVPVACAAILAAASARAAVTVVEPGHTAILHADSIAPLHPTQANLGDAFSRPIESLTVNPTTGVIYVQVHEVFAGCPSPSTSIYAIDPAAGNAVTPVRVGTGFGICDRGSDLGYVPAINAILAQDANVGGGGRIATVDATSGAIGTWVQPSVFFSNTFGMQIAPGIGAIPAGNIVYLADLGGGINSAAFGGPNVFRAPFPGGGGDDLYVQPDGDIVFIGDAGEGIWVYDPFTFAPTPAGVPSAAQIYSNAGLSFGCGTRATVCPDTGAGFLAWSCQPGAPGIFRLDEALTTATLLVRVTPDFQAGVQDITVGPASDGSANRSLYFTVTDQSTGANQVWEVTSVCAAAANTPPTCDAGGPYLGSCRGVAINGVTVNDPDGGSDEIRYTSLDPSVTLSVPSSWMPVSPGALPSFRALLDPLVAPCGVTADILIEVRDASNPTAVSTCTATVTFEDVTPPTLGGVPADVAVDCSAVPGPAAVTAMDSCDVSPNVSFAELRIDGPCPGTYQLQRTWTATDHCGNSASASQTVTVTDTTPPVITAAEEPLGCLWPPNHWYVCFDTSSLAVAATDDCSGPVAIQVVGCSSNQPDDAPDPDSDFNGDGSTTDDCLVSADGATICVRAERAGGGPGAQDGRTYSVLVVAVDQCGNASEPTPAGTVHVPHDQSPAEDGCLDPTKVGIKPKDLLP